MEGPSSSLFPLPLEPFEWYMLEDDYHDRFSMTVTVTVDVSGTLDQQAFVESVSDALERHPLFTAVVAKRGMLCPEWIAGSAPPNIEFVNGYRTQFPDGHAALMQQLPAEQDAATPNKHASPAGTRINLTEHPGLKITVYWQQDLSAVCFHFHHATADGLGCHRFIGDVFAFYGQRTSFGDPPQITPIDLSLLRCRAQLSPEVKSAMKTRQYWNLAARQTYDYLGCPPAIVAAAKETAGQNESQSITAQTRCIPSDRLRRLRRVLHERKTTLNDLLLCELLRSLRDWNMSHGRPDKERLRLVIPNSLRGAEMARLPAANVMHYMFLTFRGRDITDTPGFLDKVTVKMREQVDLHMGSVYQLLSRGATYLPGFLPLYVKRGNSKGTAVGSFMGDPTRSYAAIFPRNDGRCVAGNVTIERFSVLGTVRPGTFVNLSTSVYADQVFLSLTVDERHCGPGAAKHFAHDLQQRVLAHTT